MILSTNDELNKFFTSENSVNIGICGSFFCCKLNPNVWLNMYIGIDMCQ